jgi:glutamate-5-semialdehyde dehydrogenase
MNQLRNNAIKLSKNANIASKSFALISAEIRNKILLEVRELIIRNSYNILNINKNDVSNAYKNNLPDSKINRLIINQNSIDKMVNSLDEIINLSNPLGKISYDVTRENALHIQRISVPIGVLMAIYESRPNVTCDIASLAIKSGNLVILRSGSEAFETSKIIANLFREALKKFNIDENVVSFCDNSDREFIKYLLKMDKYIDVIIPRGSKALIQAISRKTRIPLFKHLDGNCHTYINEFADLQKARKIVFNAKLRRTEICGATESILVDKKIASEIIPLIADDLINAGCEIRGDVLSIKIDNRIKPASIKDYYLEYLDKIVSLKIVKNINEAILHINKYGSSHTESIITENDDVAQKFFNEINSAIVMHNASTQFADGGEFGFGCEVGISTGKLHARGPVGLEQLTTHKYIINSKFAIRK